MSEFMERHSVARLVGAPPGYVGFDEGGQLTETVRRKSYCAILLDEVEKAHPEVFNILLQIFDDGHLTDSKGRKVDFRNSIIVMTSNIGSDLIKRDTTIGFTVKGDEDKLESKNHDRMKSKVMEEVKRFFRPEFLNRVDSTVVFHALNRANILKIVDLMIAEVSKSLLEKGIFLEVTQATKDFLTDQGFDPVFGARPLRREIQNHIEDKLADEFLRGKFGAGDTVEIDVEDGEVIIRPRVPVTPI
jgi:ATP-dependent Clp protease ATP-binding subunit ClpC